MHQGIPDELPYTVAAEEFRTDPWLGSTADVLVSEEQVIKKIEEPLYHLSIAGRVCQSG